MRREAAEVLSNIGPQVRTAVPALLKALRDDDAGVRAAAAGALTHVKPETQPGILELVQSLKDKDDEVRDRAIEALRALGAESVPSLVQALGDKENKQAAFVALAGLGPQAKGAVPDLSKLLKDPDPLIRRHAANVLGRVGRGAIEAVPASRQRWKTRIPSVRRTAVEALNGIEGRQRLTPSAPAPSKTAKADPKEKPLSQWIKELDDTDPKTRLHAVEAINAIGPDAKEALPVLTRLLKEKDIPLRVAVIKAIGGIGDPTAVPALVEARSRVEIKAVREALVAIGPKAVPALVQLIREHKDPQVREDAINLLEPMGSHAKAAIPALSQALHDKDAKPPITVSAAEALGRMGPDAVPALIDGLSAKDPRVRSCVAVVLGNMNEHAEKAVPALRNWQRKTMMKKYAVPLPGLSKASTGRSEWATGAAMLGRLALLSLAFLLLPVTGQPALPASRRCQPAGRRQPPEPSPASRAGASL